VGFGHRTVRQPFFRGVSFQLAAVIGIVPLAERAFRGVSFQLAVVIGIVPLAERAITGKRFLPVPLPTNRRLTAHFGALKSRDSRR
jgi:hypothetical protein